MFMVMLHRRMRYRKRIKGHGKRMKVYMRTNEPISCIPILLCKVVNVKESTLLFIWYPTKMNKY